MLSRGQINRLDLLDVQVGMEEYLSNVQDADYAEVIAVAYSRAGLEREFGASAADLDTQETITETHDDLRRGLLRATSLLRVSASLAMSIAFSSGIDFPTAATSRRSCSTNDLTFSSSDASDSVLKLLSM